MLIISIFKRIFDIQKLFINFSYQYLTGFIYINNKMDPMCRNYPIKISHLFVKSFKNKNLKNI